MFTKKSKVVRVAHNAAAAAAAKSAGFTRNDVGCGVKECHICKAAQHSEAIPPVIDGSQRTILIPDTNVLLHNINVIEDSRVHNIVLLSTVLAEVNNRNKAVYARLQRIMADEAKACYVFSNDRHEQTYCSKRKDESPNDYNDRCIRVAAQWYARHMVAALPEAPPSVCLVSHDKVLRAIVDATVKESQVAAVTNGDPNTAAPTEKSFSQSKGHKGERVVPADAVLLCLGLREYIERAVSSDCDLLEKLQYIIPEGMKETPSTGPLYSEYWSTEATAAGIASGTLFKGKLRVSEANCFFGEIRGKWEGKSFSRILIPGRTNMNRSIHDDIVAVELLPVSQWRGPSPRTPSLTDDVPEALALEQKYTPCGRVIGIVEQRRRPFCGSLDEEDVKQLGEGVAGSVTVLFQPKNSRFPRIRIRTSQLQDLKDKRLCVVLDEWTLYSSFPTGHYTEVLGQIGDKDTEAKVILIENDIPHYDFSEAVYNCLPKGEWSVSKEEVSRRLDFRDLCVVSVDPLGCRDIDDALHCRIINGNHYEVGVHIADVSHFLQEGTPMDVEASKRSTSVYLVDRRIDMLPKLLTENLCSLVAGEDRYVFSVLWEFDENFNLLRTHFGKAIIHSRAALYYGDAQKMIDDPDDISDVAMSLKRLMRLSQHFKELREKAGALFLASQEFKFKVDDDHVNPTDMHAYQSFEANSMIEEWMLYANAAVAQKVYDSYPHWTLLRRHQAPAENAFDTLNEALQRKINVSLDGTTSLSLNQSLDKCVDPEDDYFNKLVRILTTRCMCQAQYFSSSEVPKDEFKHYGLAMPIYTHFTSPIRRYSDVIVHRQLAAAMGILAVSEAHMKPERIEALAANMNYRHEQAQKAGRDSQNLFTGFFLRNYAEKDIPRESGYVVRVTESDVFVLVPRYGQEGKVPRNTLAQMPELLDRVEVNIAVKKEKGDVLRTKLEYTLAGMSRPGDDGDANNGVLRSPEAVLCGGEYEGVDAPPRKRYKGDQCSK